MARLSRTDLEAVLALAAEVSAAARERARPDRWLLERISGLVGADVAAYSQFGAPGELLTDTEYPGPAWVPTEAESALLNAQNPFIHYAARTRDRYYSATRLSDVVDDMPAFRRTELYALLSAELPHEVQMRMPGTPGTTWLLAVARSGRDYAERDMRVLDALRPFLIASEAHRALADTVAALQSVPRAEVTGAGLSARENQVLDLVAGGASNVEIAERLWISVGTVRKHLENIYVKLEVGSRTAALARTGRSSVSGASRTG